MGIVTFELGPATPTDLRPDFDDFIDLFGRFEKPT
jgi:hypothetical protein